MTSIAAGGQSNVIQLIGAQNRRLNVVDQELASYLKDLNSVMQEKAGVAYIAIRSSLHGSDLDAIRSFLDNGVAPAEAVAQIMSDHGLKSVNAKIPHNVAGAYNKVQAAISEFLANTQDWHRSDDGRIYSVMDETVAFLHPVRYRKVSPNEPEAFGFGIELREGAEVDFYEGTIVSEGSQGERFAGWDLGQPLEAMHKHIASRDQAREFSF
ncbi:hypothetical protein G6L37_03820 [Agrobacterium rubi]|nr:hypothetical protein [Agrobacterium rubi]NTF24477.1 hypothetical protein [Agrobacterium rubi]